MGNNSIFGKKERYLSKEEIMAIDGLESSINKIFNKYKNSNGVITIKELKNLSKGLLTNSICKKIIKIIGSEKDKLNNDELIYFFGLLITNSFQAKLNLLLDFIFSRKKKLDKNKYIHKVLKYYQQSSFITDILLNKEMIEKSNTFEKEEIYNYIKDNYYNEINEYKLYDKDNYILNNNNEENDNNNEINNVIKELKICKCLLNKNIIKSSSSQSYMNIRLDKKIKNKYLEKEFKKIEAENGHIFPIVLLEDMLKELNVIQSLIDVIGNYLRKKTQKCFLSYDLFEELLSLFQITDDNNKENYKNKIIDDLFKLFSYPNDYVEKPAIFIFIKSTKKNLSSSIINKLFDNNKIEKYIYKDKFKLIIDYMINDLLESFEHIKYMPYIFFNQDLEEKKLEKNCIDILLKGKPINEYILERIEYDKKFYIIDYKFWKNWNDSMANNINDFETLNINIKDICYNGGRLKEGLAYLKDYIILSPRLYLLFSMWYNFPETDEIERERINLFDDEDQKVDINKEILGITKNNIDNNKENETEIMTMPTSPKYKEKEFDTQNDYFFRNKNYEIEVFPVFLVFYKMEDIIKKGLNTLSFLKEHMRKIARDKINFKYNKFSKKTKISGIIEQLQEYFKNQLTPNIARLWIYYNDILEIIPYEDTLEKHGITNVAFAVIELKQNGVWQSAKLDINNSILKDKTHIPLVGLVNIGNSCYMNSVLQIFFNIPQIKKIFVDQENGDKIDNIIEVNQNLMGFIQNKKNILLKSFLYLLLQKWLGTKKTLNPHLFKEICGEYNETFKEYEQQDAYDFYTFLLDILHEEANIKLNNKQIKYSDNIDISEEDLGNEYWANTVRNNASYFYALFMGQLQSKLICTKCKTEKIKFEPFNALNLPIPEGDKIIIKICLFRLPLTLSPFYDNETLKNEINKNDDKSIRNKIINSKNSNNVRKKLLKIKNIQIVPYIKYSNVNAHNNKNNKNGNEMGIQISNTRSEKDFNLNTEFYEFTKKEKEVLKNENGEEIISNALIFNIPVMIKIEIDRNKKCQEIIDILKSMKELYLDTGNIYTEFIIMNEDFNIIEKDKIINNCIFPLKEIYIYELLSYEGIRKVFGYGDLQNDDNNIIKINDIKDKVNSTIDNENFNLKINTIQTINKENHINEQNNNINIFSNKNNYINENLIEIMHRCRKDRNNKNDFFYIQDFEEIRTYKDFIILTNKQAIKPFHLYEMIWEKYMYFLDKPDNKYLWWKYNKNIENNNEINIKNCSPFMLKFVNKINNSCAFCPWYKFCTGCVLSPENNDYLDINSDWILVIEWCKEIVENEINKNNIHLKLFHSSFKKEFNIIENKYDKISIYDCLQLFTQKEILKDILCENCNIKTTFTKELKIERLPEYLFVVFKRFKFISKYSTKIESLISFPFEDLKLDNYLMKKNKKIKRYDLFAVINHMGSMSKGHYYCNIKQKNKWIKYEDSYVIEDNDINISNVYLLVYKANNKEYYNNKKYDFHFNFLGLMNTAYQIYIKQFNFVHLFNYILNEKGEIIEEFKNNCQYYYGEPITINKEKGFLVNAYKKNNDIYVKIKTNKGFIETKANNLNIKDTIKEDYFEEINNINKINQNKAICSGCLIN